MRNKILSLLVLLLTAASGAWAQGAFSSDPYTSTREFNSVSVTSSMTLNINEGVIVTVNSGLTIEDGVTLTLTGGGRLSVFGKSGNWGIDAYYEEGTLINEATAGGDGKPAIILNGNAKIVIDNGEIYAEGGQGGFGGADATAGTNQPDGAAGNAFSRFPTIDGATLYYKSSNEWFKYTSGDQTLYNKMKAVPATIEVTTNKAEGETTFTEAWFNMPAFDATAEYELVRDMSVQMTAQVGDGTQEQPRYRVKKDGNKFIPADMEMAAVPALFTVNDAIEQKALTQIQDYIVQIYAIDAEGQPTGDPMTFATFTFEPGIYAVKAVAADGSDYDGETALSNTFKLFQGYEIEVPAGEFATFYKDEPLYADTETSADAVLYTVSSVSADKAVLSSAITTAPSLTPLLVFNSSEVKKTFLLIPADAEPNLAVTVAPEFVGTLEATTIAASTEALNNYALNGKQFVWVKDAIAVDANKAWLAIPTSNITARQISIVFGDATGIDSMVNGQWSMDTWYDLNGRKLQAAPTKKGVYILNGRKVVVK